MISCLEPRSRPRQRQKGGGGGRDMSRAGGSVQKKKKKKKRSPALFLRLGWGRRQRPLKAKEVRFFFFYFFPSSSPIDAATLPLSKELRRRRKEKELARQMQRTLTAGFRPAAPRSVFISRSAPPCKNTQREKGTRPGCETEILAVSLFADRNETERHTYSRPRSFNARRSRLLEPQLAP